MTQDPHRGEQPRPDGGSTPPQPSADGPGQPPDYRPAAAGGPGQIPGTGQYANPVPANTSALILTIVSGVLTLSGICCVVGIVPLVLGVIALTQNSTDPEQSRKLTRIGWVTLVVLTILLLLALGGMFLYAFLGTPSGGYV